MGKLGTGLSFVVVLVVVMAGALFWQQGEISDARDDVEALEAEVDSLREERETLGRLLVRIAERLNGLERGVGSVESDVDALSSDVREHGDCIEELVDVLGISTVSRYGSNAPFGGGC